MPVRAAPVCNPVPPAAAAVQPVTPPVAITAPMTPPQVYSPTVMLSADDQAAIYDLQVAYRNSLEVEVNNRDQRQRDHANFSDLVNIAELSVRRVIAMAKQVPAFRTLPQVRVVYLD